MDEMRQEMQDKKQREIANNANTINNAADVAIASGHPVASAIGHGVKIADKISGGKSSEMLGKKIRNLNKIAPGGRKIQKLSNKLSESGAGDKIGQAARTSASKGGNSNTSDRINNAMNKKNTNNAQTKKNAKGNIPNGAANDKHDIKDKASDGGSADFKVSFKAVRIGLMVCACVFPVIIIVCLFMGGSQTYIKSVGLGSADSISAEEAEEKINKKQETPDELNEEVTEDDLSYDIFIEDSKTFSFKKSKLEEVNLVPIAKTTYLDRKYNEADLDNLEDFYPSVNDLSKNYDENMVYDFFFKMHKLYTTYRDKYKVHLDLPLLMSTLTIQSNDMNEIFVSNLSKEDREKYERTNYDDFDYYYNWNGYITTPTTGTHDMEILAQHMVSETSSDKCDEPVNGKCYVIDKDKYNEFLKQFIEKKYYVKGVPIYTNGSNVSGDSCSTGTEFIKYNLTEDQILQIASLAIREQGTVKGAAAEASLMANLFEIQGSKYGTGADGLYKYIRTSRWFASAAEHMDSRNASADVVAAVKSVLVDGKRTLPGYINEHDWINDIGYITTDGKEISRNDRASYVKFNTKIKNIYGSTYTFYSFPDTNSDPFGYTSEKIRKEKGEFHYDFDTGQPVVCNNSSNNEYADAIITLANKEIELNAGKSGDKYNAFFGFSSGTPWCANFVSYLLVNTTVNGVSLYPNVVDFKTASTGQFINNFYNSRKENINFYYNDSCSNLKGKNGEIKYTPKKGDIIFIDWDAEYYDISSKTQDHTAIVEKYVDGIIYTIEGNYGTPSRIKKSSYSISDCKVIGFGSWY